MPLVEIIPGAGTKESVTRRVEDTLKEMGKRPVRIDRDVPGFVWNRLQLALLREAAWVVENGVATPEVVDEIVRDGLARRWRLTGPFETVALGGPDTFTRIAANLFPVLSTERELRDVSRWLPASADAREEIKARRDRGLLEELQRDRSRE
jgi:3-hydroxybutyryl-CoA dehydrogenase